MDVLNNEVSQFLDELNHPFRSEIEQLRQIIIQATNGLTENIKWNGPNYSWGGQDRITMRVQPLKKQVQLIFHRGAKKLDQPKEKLIQVNTKLLSWKENDRAIVAFNSKEDIEKSRLVLIDIISKWIEAAR